MRFFRWGVGREIIESSELYLSGELHFFRQVWNSSRRWNSIFLFYWISLIAFHKRNKQLGLVERVVVIFSDSNNVPLERFVFKLNVNQSYGLKLEEADVEFSFKSFLIKLPLSQSLMKVLPLDCTWEIIAYFRALLESSSSKDAEMCVPTDARQWQQVILITPIKSMSSEPLRVQLYVEHPSLSEPHA